MSVYSCVVCGGIVDHLVCHHWYEPPLYERHEVLCCVGCNIRLLPRPIWRHVDSRVRGNTRKWYHVLPSLDLQREWLLCVPEWDPWGTPYGLSEADKAIRDGFDRKLRDIYGSPLPDPPIGVVLQ